MNILVTGSTGFLGKHVCRYLFPDHFVVGTSRSYISYKKPIEHVHGKIDLTDPSQVKNLFVDRQNKPDVIIHLAANPLVKLDTDNPSRIIDDNIKATLNLAEMAPECHFIYASTVTVYGDPMSNQRPFVESDKCNPKSIYAITKLASEQILDYYNDKLQVTHMRLPATIERTMSHGVIRDLFYKFISDKSTLEVLGSKPGSRKPFLYVSDFIRALDLIIRHRLTGIYNVVPDGLVSVERITEIIMERADQPKPVKWLGEQANWKGDNPALIIDSNALRKCGWTPEHTSEQSVIRVVEEYYARNRKSFANPS